MAQIQIKDIQAKLRKVNRRLFLQTLVNSLLICWAGALLLTAIWFLCQPFVLGNIETWIRWATLGGMFAAGTIAGLVMAFVRAPSRLEAALALDSKFGLKERVTTSLTLASEQVQSPAGQALLTDVHKQLEGLKVTSRFPLQITWPRALTPFAAALLAILAIFFEPDLSTTEDPNENPNQLTAAQKEEIKEQQNRLQNEFKKKKKDKTERSKEEKELDAEWQKLINQKFDPNNKEQVRKQVLKIRKLEEKLKTRMNQLKSQAQKKDNLKKLLQQLNAMEPGQKRKKKDGPGKDLMDAIKKGDMEKAKKELQKLQKKLKKKELSKEDLAKLKEQLGDMQSKLKRLLDQEDLKKKLQEAFENGDLSKEQLERAMEQLEEEKGDLEELQDLAELLKGCQNCLGEGNLDELGRRLKILRAKLDDFNWDELEEELKECRGNCDLLLEIRQRMCRCLGNNPDGLPLGPRPQGEETETKAFRARQKAHLNPTGESKITGIRRGGRFTKVREEEIQEVFQSKAQEAQEAIERQRISPEEADILKGYYENLSGQKK